MKSWKTVECDNVVKTDKLLLIGMLPYQQIGLSGHFEFGVVRGAVSVFGRTVHSDEQWLETRGEIEFLRFESSKPLGFKAVKWQSWKGSKQLNDDVEQLYRQWEFRKSNPQSTILALRPLGDFSLDQQQLLGSIYTGPLYYDIEQWQLLDFKKAVVIGNRNTGKSTLSQLLCNYTQECVYLDCDLGQPQFTPYGMLSLLHVQSPLFDRKPQMIRSLFLGTNSAQYDPDLYVESLTRLVNLYHQSYSHLPLVVNTSGWVKAMGLDLLLHLLNIVQPDLIYQMHDFEERETNNPKNIPELPLSFETRIQKTPQTLFRSKTNAAEQRQMVLEDYFRNLVYPYSLSWSSVYIKFMIEDVPFSQSMVALNGSIVGLIHDPALKPAQQVQFHPFQLPMSMEHHCLGLGLIRSIDPETQVFHILTPIHPQDLNDVNLIVKASIDTPISFYLKHQSSERAPYLWLMHEGIGGQTLRNRHIQRKK
ncbi:hypothetical protein EDD86DRAFT_211599 [Gorgonomyces haynaldii]|nr:hypothetical protein EDD86DRAFT_211599 [Gorgonomyces haynaldii]